MDEEILTTEEAQMEKIVTILEAINAELGGEE